MKKKINKIKYIKFCQKFSKIKKSIDIKKKSMTKLKRKINWNIQNKILLREFNEA